MAVNKKTGNMTSPVRIDKQVLNNLTVTYSHLLRPDTYKGQSKHSISVIRTKEMEKLFKELKAQTNLETINGLSEYERDENGKKVKVKVAKFSNKLHAEDGVERFPGIVDENKNDTNEVPMGGDIVNLIIKPRAWDDSISLYLEKVQIVEQDSHSSVDFEVIGDGETEDEGLPF
tara:strand:+ start:1171 stop:1692 length:522 start_codon:yes stop_codon:yes gene_type:complete